MKQFLSILLISSLILVSGCSKETEDIPDTREKDLMAEITDNISNFNVFVSSNFSEIANIATGKDSKFILIDDRYDNLTDLDDDSYADFVDAEPAKEFELQDGYCVSYDWRESSYLISGTCKAADNESYSFTLTFIKNEDGTFSAINRAEGPHDTPMEAGDVEISQDIDNGTIGDNENIPDYDPTYDFPDNVYDTPSTDNNFAFGNTEETSTEDPYEFGDSQTLGTDSDREFGDIVTSSSDNNYEFSNPEISDSKEGE